VALLATVKFTLADAREPAKLENQRFVAPALTFGWPVTMGCATFEKYERSDAVIKVPSSLIVVVPRRTRGWLRPSKFGGVPWASGPLLFAKNPK